MELPITSSMAVCAQCDARLSTTAAWCGQCYAPVQVESPTFAAGGPGSFGTGPRAKPSTTGDPDRFRGPTRSHTVDQARRDGRLLGGRAVGLTALAILLGALFQGATWLYLRENTVEPATLVRYLLVATFAFYCVVGGLVLVPLVGHVRLRWNDGAAAANAMIGVVVGGGLAGLLVWVLSTRAGETTTDEGARLLLSEGSLGHVLAVVLIICIAAPLVEEVLFRGLLLESLRSTGLGLALGVSSAAFSAWHLNLSQWWYYALMGGLLGAVYLRRGLVASMAAHAAFNGVLVAVAVSLVLAPGAVVHSNGMSIPAPQGWDQQLEELPGELFDVVLTGPSGATVVIAHEPATTVSDVATILRTTQESGNIPLPDGGSINGADAAIVELPVGDAVGIELEVGGYRGEMYFVPRGEVVYEVFFMNGGSAKASRDFRVMMDGLELPG